MITILDDAQGKIKSLIQNVSELEKQISHPYEAKKNNLRNSILTIIPKYLLLTRILPYLTMRQCYLFSNVSVFIRRTIYNPLGWIILTQTHSPYQIIFIDNSSAKRPYLKKQISFSEAEDHLQDYQDQQFLIRERSKYREILWSKYKSHTSLKQKNQLLHQKVRIQKMYLFKKKLQKIYYQRQKQDLETENIRFKQKLKRLTTEFVIRDDKLTKKIQQIEKQNFKLQKQKEALVVKIKQYQQQMPNLEQKAEKSKKNLNYLKQFLSKHQYQPIQQVE